MKLFKREVCGEGGGPNEQGQRGRVLKQQLQETVLPTSSRMLQTAQGQRFMHSQRERSHIARLQPVAVNLNLRVRTHISGYNTLVITGPP